MAETEQRLAREIMRLSRGEIEVYSISTETLHNRSIWEGILDQTSSILNLANEKLIIYIYIVVIF